MWHTRRAFTAVRQVGVDMRDALSANFDNRTSWTNVRAEMPPPPPARPPAPHTRTRSCRWLGPLSASTTRRQGAWVSVRAGGRCQCRSCAATTYAGAPVARAAGAPQSSVRIVQVDFVRSAITLSNIEGAASSVTISVGQARLAAGHAHTSPSRTGCSPATCSAPSTPAWWCSRSGRCGHVLRAAVRTSVTRRPAHRSWPPRAVPTRTRACSRPAAPSRSAGW
jgi:hypothetical protein